MSDWDPFKPVRFGRTDSEFNAFSPSNMYDPAPASETWAMEANRQSNSWAFQTSDSYTASKSETWAFSSSKQENFYSSEANKSSSSWGYSSGNEDKKSGWGSSRASSDELGFGLEQQCQRLKDRESQFNRSWVWEDADVNWAFESVNQSLENQAKISHMECPQSRSYESEPASSSWSFSPPKQEAASLASSWVWEPTGESNGSERGSFNLWDETSCGSSKAFEPIEGSHTAGSPLKRW